MISLATKLLDMFWPRIPRDRRKSTPEERQTFEAKRDEDAHERATISQRLDILAAEASVWSRAHDVSDSMLEKRRTKQ